MNGPWEQRVILRDNNGTNASKHAAGWHCGENNPSAVITANGTFPWTWTYMRLSLFIVGSWIRLAADRD